jgi:hypothetical protein
VLLGSVQKRARTVDHAVALFGSPPASATLHRNIHSEILAYRQEPTAELNADPLVFWKHNEVKYPRLAQEARRFLAFPATSASAERAFSVAGIYNF